MVGAVHVAPSLPWLDCRGNGFDPAWERLVKAMAAEVAIAATQADVGLGVTTLAAVPAARLAALPLWGHGSPPATPPDGPEAYGRVLNSEEHPRHLRGHCHLGTVALEYARGRVRVSRGQRSEARRDFGEAWRALSEVPGSSNIFHLLESSTWGALVTAADVLRALATEEGQVSVVQHETRRSPLELVCPPASSPALSPPKSAGWMSASSSVEDMATHFGRNAIGNLSVAAVSTHVAIVEPVASLRAQAELRQLRMPVRFMGVMHPNSRAPCEFLPKESLCTNAAGWGRDVHWILHPLADMRDDRFQEEGFVPLLFKGLSQIYRRHIASWAHVIICAHPFLVCAILRALTPLFMLIYITPTPLTLVPEADRLWVLGQLSALSAHKLTAMLAASQVYALHILYQVGAAVQATRPSSLYIAEKHRWHGRGSANHVIYCWGATAISSEFVIAAIGLFKEGRDAGVPWLQEPKLLFKELGENRYVGWDYFEGLRCVVLLPWDLQLTAFAELYALGVPLVLPTADYIASYAVRVLARRGVTFWAVHPRFAGRLPGERAGPFEFEPWLPLGGGSAAALLRAESQFLYWFSASDFETFGHTLRFKSIPELLCQAAGTTQDELRAISRAMSEEWAHNHIVTASAYERVLLLLLAREGSKNNGVTDEADRGMA